MQISYTQAVDYVVSQLDGLTISGINNAEKICDAVKILRKLREELVKIEDVIDKHIEKTNELLREGE